MRTLRLTLIASTVCVMAALSTTTWANETKENAKSDSANNSAPAAEDGFVSLFNGKNLDGWHSTNKGSFEVEDGAIASVKMAHGNLFTEKEYGDFILRFEFKLTPGANNGLGIRAPLEGDAAYQGMELQILDNSGPGYAERLKPYQFHGSVYGVAPAKRDHQKPVGQWNEQEVVCRGSRVKVTLNGAVILDVDVAEASKNGTPDHKSHPGLKRKKGHIGFLGHRDVVFFRNIRIKPLDRSGTAD